MIPTEETAFAAIHIAAGRDGLDFRPGVHIGSDESWVAETYIVHRWKKGWAYSRPDHPVLGKLHGQRNTRALAMRSCAEDWVIVARLKRWDEHMKTHEPPP